MLTSILEFDINQIYNMSDFLSADDKSDADNSADETVIAPGESYSLKNRIAKQFNAYHKPQLLQKPIQCKVAVSNERWTEIVNKKQNVDHRGKAK